MSRPILEALFGAGAKSKVLQQLYSEKAEGTVAARALARLAGVPYGSIHKTLNELVNSQLVVRENSARGPQYRAPHEDTRLRGLFLLIRQDSAIVKQIQRVLKPIRGMRYACIFGSFATGRTHKGSDIDVLVLEGEGADRFAAMTALSKASGKLARPIDPQFYSVEEFLAKASEGEPVTCSILAGPRIALRGVEPWKI